MANQDPQPEIYTTRHSFAAEAAAGTTNTVTVYTNQANNEEVRIYAVAVRILDDAGTAATTDTDFALQVQVGPNSVPSNQFDIGWLHDNLRNGGAVLAFSTPVLVLSNNLLLSRSKLRRLSQQVKPELLSSILSVNSLFKRCFQAVLFNTPTMTATPFE